MGFLSSPLLCLRSALIRKFPVSQDNAPPLKTPLQPLGFLDPDQQLARSRENVGSGLLMSGESPAVARVRLGEPHTAHKHIYAPLTLGRREGQMAAPEKGKEGGCAGERIDLGKPTATPTCWGLTAHLAHRHLHKLHSGNQRGQSRLAASHWPGECSGHKPKCHSGCPFNDRTGHLLSTL